MSIYSNVTEQDLINLRKLAEQQKNQRDPKIPNIKNRILKQTHDVKLAESLSPITKNLDDVNKSTQEVGEIIKKSHPSQNIKTILQNSQSQTPAIENTNISQSLLDTLAFMKTSKNLFKLTEDDCKVYWKEVLINPIGDNRIVIKDGEYEISPDIQACFTNTKLTTNFLDNFEEETVFDILQNVGFYDNIPKIGFKAARMKEALYDLPKAIDKIRNPPLPTIENVEDSSDLEGLGIKIIIPNNIIDIHTRLEVLLGLKLSGHTDTLTEASNLIDNLYKLEEIQNKQQYQNALNKFSKYLILTNIYIFILRYTHSYNSFFTFIKYYVTYKYTSIYT